MTIAPRDYLPERQTIGQAIRPPLEAGSSAPGWGVNHPPSTLTQEIPI